MEVSKLCDGRQLLQQPEYRLQRDIWSLYTQTETVYTRESFPAARIPPPARYQGPGHTDRDSYTIESSPAARIPPPAKYKGPVYTERHS